MIERNRNERRVGWLGRVKIVQRVDGWISSKAVASIVYDQI